MKREITDAMLEAAAPLPPVMEKYLTTITKNFPVDRSVEFWDGALWAMWHFDDVANQQVDLRTQMLGFMYALAFTYKQALAKGDGEWASELDV